jgi:hypothetical protein
MIFKLRRTTFDKIEVGQYFYKVDNKNELVCFKKLSFQKAISTNDNSVDSLSNWTGVFYGSGD